MGATEPQCTLHGRDVELRLYLPLNAGSMERQCEVRVRSAYQREAHLRQRQRDAKGDFSSRLSASPS